MCVCRQTIRWGISDIFPTSAGAAFYFAYRRHLCKAIGFRRMRQTPVFTAHSFFIKPDRDNIRFGRTGITFLLETIARKHSNILVRPLVNPLCIQAGLAWNKERYISNAAQAFINFIKEFPFRFYEGH